PGCDQRNTEQVFKEAAVRLVIADHEGIVMQAGRQARQHSAPLALDRVHVNPPSVALRASADDTDWRSPQQCCMLRRAFHLKAGGCLETQRAGVPECGW